MKMRTCGQCGEEFVDCLARREEHYKYECVEGRNAWNAARIAEGRATKKKEILGANRPFKVTRLTFEFLISKCVRFVSSAKMDYKQNIASP